MKDAIEQQFIAAGYTQDKQGRWCPPKPVTDEATELFADTMEARNFPASADRIRNGDISIRDRAAIELLAAKLAAVRAERDA